MLATIVHAELEGDRGIPAFLEHAARECEWFRGRVIASHDDDDSSPAFDGPARAIRCAAALVGAAARFTSGIRIGLHTGECTVEAGVPKGPPVELAARISSAASVGEVLVSRTVRDIVGDAGLPFEDRGVHSLGGFGDLKLFSA